MWSIYITNIFRTTFITIFKMSRGENKNMEILVLRWCLMVHSVDDVLQQLFQRQFSRKPAKYKHLQGLEEVIFTDSYQLYYSLCIWKIAKIIRIRKRKNDTLIYLKANTRLHYELNLEDDDPFCEQKLQGFSQSNRLVKSSSQESTHSDIFPVLLDFGLEIWFIT